jgi:hypothetical protein
VVINGNNWYWKPKILTLPPLLSPAPNPHRRLKTRQRGDRDRDTPRNGKVCLTSGFVLGLFTHETFWHRIALRERIFQQFAGGVVIDEDEGNQRGLLIAPASRVRTLSLIDNMRRVCSIVKTTAQKKSNHSFDTAAISRVTILRDFIVNCEHTLE